jgi:hypothetical protein
MAYDSALYGPLLLWTAEPNTSQEIATVIASADNGGRILSLRRNIELKLVLVQRQSALVRDWI